MVRPLVNGLMRIDYWSYITTSFFSITKSIFSQGIKCSLNVFFFYKNEYQNTCMYECLVPLALIQADLGVNGQL